MCFFANTAFGAQSAEVAVFVVHGLSQRSGDMEPLGMRLRGELPDEYQVDWSFDWSHCSDNPNCSRADCSLDAVAQALATHIARQMASVRAERFAVIGYSTGGVIARDLILNDYGDLRSRYGLRGLVTLAAPNLGYPFCDIDDGFGGGIPVLGKCPIIVQQLASDLTRRRRALLSDYLQDLTARWESVGTIDWLAVGGTACKGERNSPPNFHCRGTIDGNRSGNLQGCRRSSDGLICESSALFDLGTFRNLSGTAVPTRTHSSHDYIHTTPPLLMRSSAVTARPLQCIDRGAPTLFEPGQEGQEPPWVQEVVDFLGDPIAGREPAVYRFSGTVDFVSELGEEKGIREGDRVRGKLRYDMDPDEYSSFIFSSGSLGPCTDDQCTYTPADTAAFTLIANVAGLRYDPTDHLGDSNLDPGEPIAKTASLRRDGQHRVVFSVNTSPVPYRADEWSCQLIIGGGGAWLSSVDFPVMLVPPRSADVSLSCMSPPQGHCNDGICHVIRDFDATITSFENVR